MSARRLLGWVVLLATLLTAVGALLPLSPESIAPMRAHFYVMLHYALMHRDEHLISTFGPLGFLFYPIYVPETFPWLFALRLVLATVTCWALAWIGYAAWDGIAGAIVAVGVCAPFLASPDVWFLLLPLLAALIELPRRPAPTTLRAALGVAIGLACLIKFSVLLAALAALTPLAAATLLARRVPVVAAASVSTTALVWMALGYGWADWLAYLDWSAREISAGYSSAMQLPSDGYLAANAACVSAAVLIAGAALTWGRLRRGGWGVAVALAVVLVMLFKAGFVRADVHVYITCAGLIVIAVLLAVLYRPRTIAAIGVTLFLLVLPALLWMQARTIVGPVTLYFAPIFPWQAAQQLADEPAALAGGLQAAHARTLADIHAISPLPPLDGGVDIYPGNSALPLAYGADFRPRPVFESYMAYTPRLARANADALLGARAPEWILFRVEPIDGRLPPLDDGLSWPILFTHYRFTEHVNEFALLKRTSTPLDWRLEPIRRIATQTDTDVPVPSAAAGPIWVQIDIHETSRGAVKRTLLGAPTTMLVLLCRDGQHDFRLVPALARAGFLLSPLIATTDDFVELPLRYDSVLSHEVVALRIPTFSARPRRIDVQFFRLILDAQPQPNDGAGSAPRA